MGLSTMRGKWHLHVEGTFTPGPPLPRQVLRLLRRYRTEPGGHNKGQASRLAGFALPVLNFVICDMENR